MTVSHKPTPCAIRNCGKDIYSPACPHPWHLPFSDWPGHMKDQILAQIPKYETPGS